MNIRTSPLPRPYVTIPNSTNFRTKSSLVNNYLDQGETQETPFTVTQLNHGP